MQAPKTSEIAAMLKRLGLDDKRTLLVLGESDPNVVKSCRNVKNLTTTLAGQLNPYELLRADALLLTAGGLEKVKEVFVR
jgi:large subunit ribosomal protein L4